MKYIGMKEFIDKTKKSGGHILDIISSSTGNRMLIYYRNYGDYAHTCNIKSFNIKES